MQQQSRAVRREVSRRRDDRAGAGHRHPRGQLQRRLAGPHGPGHVPDDPGRAAGAAGRGHRAGRLRAAGADEEAEVDAAPDWRGWGCIIGGLLAFIALGKFGGLVPATLALVFISAMGDRQHTVKSAALLSVGVTLLGLAVFSWGLQLQFPLFRWG